MACGGFLESVLAEPIQAGARQRSSIGWRRYLKSCDQFTAVAGGPIREMISFSNGLSAVMIQDGGSAVFVSGCHTEPPLTFIRSVENSVGGVCCTSEACCWLDGW